ncbi:hypothetical protein J4481_02485 [Candidatus Pacearchaeota archaeon]|nr:hypothetical protein [uncultured archaeon]MBS3076583.1 hypothetical protein [Candidatus Pacearchaeota archaeon]
MDENKKLEVWEDGMEFRRLGGIYIHSFFSQTEEIGYLKNGNNTALKKEEISRRIKEFLFEIETYKNFYDSNLKSLENLSTKYGSKFVSDYEKERILKVLERNDGEIEVFENALEELIETGILKTGEKIYG